MKKAKLILCLVLVLIMALSFTLSACDPEPPHEHNYVDGECSCGAKDPNYNPGGGDPEPSKISAKINADGSVTYTYPGTTELRLAVGYDGNNSTITFKTLGNDATVALPSGTYKNGDLKPTWQTLSQRLSLKISDVNTGGSNRQNEFNAWKNVNFEGVDVLMGTLTLINENGRAGKLLNLAEYLDYMPHFKAFLEANPLTYLSLLADTDTGALFSIPYFDGYDDMERYEMMQIDWVEKLLNGETDFATTATGTNVLPVNKTVAYKAYMPTTGSVDVDASNADGSAKVTLTKDYDEVLKHFKTKTWYATGTSGNIVDVAAAYRLSSGATNAGLVNVLREYIDVAYNGHYGDNRSDLFCGVNSAWDADELVVLLHCVVGNSFDLNGTPIPTTGSNAGQSTIAGIFTRDPANNQRRYDLIRLAGQLFGVRGVESRVGYMYFDSDGDLVDARQEQDLYDMCVRLNDMYKEGLIDPGYIASTSSIVTNSQGMIKGATAHVEFEKLTDKTFNANYTYYKVSSGAYTALSSSEIAQVQAGTYTADLYRGVGDAVTVGQSGFMMYDYVQTQTALNSATSKFQPILTPVALWQDGSNDDGVYMRFTESWRAVKSDGSAINIAVANSPDKLAAALAMVDYIYTPEGRVLMSYGPDDFIQTNADGSWKTFDYNGEQHPLLLESITDPSGEFYFNKLSGVSGSYTNYARRYIGATLCISEKMQSFEYQLTDANGKAGEGKVAQAVGLGIINHPLLYIPEGNNVNWWYVSLPASIATTAQEDNMINTFVNIAGTGQAFSQESGSRYNLMSYLTTATVNGDVYTVSTMVNNESKDINIKHIADKVKTNWGGAAFLIFQQEGWERQLDYYNKNLK